MSDILLIRHAETDLKGTFCGHTDPPLNNNGQQQLHTLVESLRQYDITTVHASDLLRAQLTAHAIAEAFNAPLQLDPSLREIAFGDWEALTWIEIEHRDPVHAQLWLDRYPDLSAPNGELYSAFRSRVLSAFDAIRSASSATTTAIVTHAGVIQLILTAVCGRSAQEAYKLTRQYCCVVPFSPACHD